MDESVKQAMRALTAVTLVVVVFLLAFINFGLPSETVAHAGMVAETSSSTATTPSDSPTTTPSSDPNILDKCEVIKAAGKTLHFTCYNKDGDVIPAGLITVEPEVIIKKIIKTIPGPTVTIKPPPVIITDIIKIPGPTVTHTHRILVPGPTRTVTSQPVTKTEFVTITPAPTRQTVTAYATVTPAQGLTGGEGEVRTRTETIVKRVLLGTLASLVLAALGLLAMYLGYILGQKDAEKNENKFLESIIGRVRGEGKHQY